MAEWWNRRPWAVEFNSVRVTTRIGNKVSRLLKGKYGVCEEVARTFRMNVGLEDGDSCIAFCRGILDVMYGHDWKQPLGTFFERRLEGL